MKKTTSVFLCLLMLMICLCSCAKKPLSESDVPSPVKGVTWGMQIDEAEKALKDAGIVCERTVQDSGDEALLIKDTDIFSDKADVMLLFSGSHGMGLYRLGAEFAEPTDDNTLKNVQKLIGSNFKTDKDNVWYGKKVSELPKEILDRMHTYLTETAWGKDEGPLQVSGEEEWKKHQDNHLVTAALQKDENLLIFNAAEMALAVQCEDAVKFERIKQMIK